ncbi:hypothetical protein KY284_013016 [Solanum tuberosum]|nr:hypothetical protein KY284_013016 [Solanum tuberosum]
MLFPLSKTPLFYNPGGSRLRYWASFDGLGLDLVQACSVVLITLVWTLFHSGFMMMVWYGILHNNSFGCRFELDPIGSFGRPICGSRFELRTSNSRFTEFCSQ